MYCKNLIRKFLFLASFFLFAASLHAQKKPKATAQAPNIDRPKNLSDSALLDLVQKQTFRYFWDFAHPVSGMARERTNEDAGYGHEVVTTGGTGFGIMGVIVAANRKFITRDTAAKFLLKMVNFLVKADSYHGIWAHWMNGATGKTIPFSRRDDGADLVETSYLMTGLLCAREYFNQNNPVENELRGKIGWLWGEADWNWHTRGGLDLLYWHWSPNNDWAMNFELRGWNETLITYILAASSPNYAINPRVYHKCWAESNHFYNGKEFYGIRLPLGFDYGGPLFFSQYSFLGLDPHGLKDDYADYWEQNLNHTLINYKHGANCWGLTAGDTYDGYNAYSPNNDFGTIAPTAALSAFPYTPEYSMLALKHFYFDMGDKLWNEYGFIDGFNETRNWYAHSQLAIDQGPIIVMIENYRSGLLWKLFMNAPEIQQGLKRLGFESPYLH